MDYEDKIASLEVKNKRLEGKCDNIFDQITELRTTIQEIYGDTSKSERFLCHEMLELSKRLEEIAKQVSPSATNVTVSPQINPSINQNPTITSPTAVASPLKQPEEKKKGLFGFSLDNMITLGVASVVGLIILTGLLSMFLFKLFAIFGGLFN